MVPPDLKGRVAGAAAQVEREAKGQPALLRNVAGKAASSSAQVSTNRVNTTQYSQLDADWRSSVVAFCQRAIADRYPLVRSGVGEVTLADFARFFGPSGVIDGFFQQNLKDAVDAATSVWRMRPGYSGPRLSPSTLRALQQSDVIRKAFFAASPTPGATFWLTPTNLDDRAARFLLEIDGQQIVLKHDPVPEQEVKWPGSGGSRQARIQFSPIGGGRDVVKTEVGPWAWFKLLQASTLTPTAQPERFNVTFQLEGLRADFEIRASSAFNPFGVLFSTAELEPFHCPRSL